MKFWFWALWLIDALVASVFVYFFFVGIGDGTVSSVNIGLWLTIFAVLGGILGGSFVLRSKNLGILALCALCVIALPALFLLLILGVTAVYNPRWN